MSIEGGKAIALNNTNTTLTPYVGLEYNYLDQDSFTETGAGSMSLRVGDQDEGNVRATFGVRLHNDVITPKGMNLRPFIDLAYVRDESNLFEIDASFANAPASTFNIEGTDLDKDRIRLGLGLMGNLNARTTFNVGYTGEYAGSNKYHTVAAAIRFSW